MAAVPFAYVKYLDSLESGSLSGRRGPLLEVRARHVAGSVGISDQGSSMLLNNRASS